LGRPVSRIDCRLQPYGSLPNTYSCPEPIASLEGTGGESWYIVVKRPGIRLILYEKDLWTIPP
jgi:hypothetical protein